MSSPPVVLSVAATDSGGAAGLAADLATIASLGAHGACVVTAVTAQDTTGVRAIHTVPLEHVTSQIEAVLEDLPVAAVKTGMLGTGEAVSLVADRFAGVGLPLVVDPVLMATSGAALSFAGVVDAYREVLLPVATVVTPNRAEAAALLGHDGEPAALALELTDLCPTVVLTGGPMPKAAEATCTDWLAQAGQVVPLTHPAVHTANDHGTGCTFSAALAVEFAGAGPEPMTTYQLISAVQRAARFTTSRLALSRHWDLGRGRGPIAHIAQPHLNLEVPR